MFVSEPTKVTIRPVKISSGVKQVETNKQIADDSKPVDDRLNKSGNEKTNIDTNDREERKAFKDMMPKEDEKNMPE